MNQVTSRPLAMALAIGTVLQLTMVIGGHYSPAVAMLFAVGGMLISMLAGTIYGVRSGAVGRAAAWGGALAGGGCALLGIGVSVALGDVPASVLLFGTMSSAVTGALGSLASALVTARRATRA
ncbi:MAG: hypothetical protein WD737_02785 [Gemmatimonadota bacterium]